MNKLSALTFRYLKFNIKRTITTCIGVIISAVFMYMIFTIGYSTFYSQAEEKFYEYHLGYDAVLICDGKTAREIVKLSPYYNEDSNNDIDVELSYAWVAAEGNRDIIYINDFFAMPRQFHLEVGTLPKNDNSIIASYDKSVFSNENVGDTVELPYEKDGKDYIDTKLISGFYKEDFSVKKEDTGYRLIFFNDGNFTLYGDKIYDLNEVCVFVTFKNKDDVWIEFDDVKHFLENAVEHCLYRGIEPRLFNYPLCLFEKKYWYCYKNSITDHKIRYMDACETCPMINRCGGFFSTTIHNTTFQARPIK